MKLLKIDSGKAVRVSSQIGRLGWKLSSRNWRKQEDREYLLKHTSLALNKMEHWKQNS